MMSMKYYFYCMVTMMLLVCNISKGAIVVFQSTAKADTYVQQNSPDENSGTKGALSVAGSEALNLSGQPVGKTDTFLMFNMASEVAYMDASFGSQNWIIQEISLHFVEQSAPSNSRFGIGKGHFEVRWIAADDWSETSLTWNTKDNYLGKDTDIPVGVFDNLFCGDAYIPTQRFTLKTPKSMVDDIRDGNDISFYLSALDTSIGFTFNSKEITGTRPHPYIELTAIVYDDADLNHDGYINFSDYEIIFKNWNSTGPEVDGDVNKDGIVDNKDMNGLLKFWEYWLDSNL
ncbi:MAG: hypothetical protein JW787_04685 [Sedimentisphaerales bacterium]|nr:hypothetical protein [Sedimentisphaerales bacterium]